MKSMAIFWGPVLAAFGLGTQLTGYLYDQTESRAQVSVVTPYRDLNSDGIQDLLIHTDQGVIPLYGVRKGDETVYLPTERMTQIDPRPIDYQAIEDRLNK